MFVHKNTNILCLYSLFLFWTISYFVWLQIHPASPSSLISSSSGWFEWWDQKNYLDTIKDIHAGNIKNANFWPGYSIIAYPFFLITPHNPFLIINWAAGGVILFSFFSIMKHFIGPKEATFVSILMVCFQYKLAFQSIIVPWNNIFLAVFSSLVIWFIVTDKWKNHNFVLLITFSSLAWFSRPQDGFFAVLFTIFLLLIKAPKNSRLLLLLSFGCLLLASTFTNVFYLLEASNYEVSSYLKTNVSHGFRPSLIPSRFYTLFINGDYNFFGEYKENGFWGSSPSVMKYNPFAIIGLTFFIINMHTKLNLCIIFCILISPIIFYLSFNPVGNAVHFWTYSLFHYIWILISIFGIFGYIATRTFVTNLWHMASLAKSYKKVDKAYWVSMAPFILIFLLIIIRPEQKVESVNYSFSQSSRVLLENERFEKPFSKLKFQFFNENEVNFSIPSYEHHIQIILNERKMIPWKEFYVNSSKNWVSINFTKDVKPTDKLEVQFPEFNSEISSVSEISWRL